MRTHPETRRTAARSLACAFAATVLALSSAAAAEDAAAVPSLEGLPEPAPQRPFELPALGELTLPNGLRLVVAPRPGVPLVTAQLTVLAGADADPAGRAGLAAMTAGLLSKGALRGGRPVGASELARQAEALGGSFDSAGSLRSSAIGMTVTTPRLDAALALLADVTRQPLLAAAELERARAQALDALRVGLSNPGDVAAMVARRAWWGASPYGASPTPESLKKLSRADVQAFHRAVFRPDRAVLLLVGDVTPANALLLAQRHFGTWRAPAGAVPPLDAAAPAPLAASLVRVDLPGSGQSGVVLMAPFVASDAPDRRAGDLANVVLGVGYSARLSQAVRIRRGLTYDVGSELESFPAGGMWSAAAQTDHPNADEVLRLMRAEVLRLGEAPPADDELAARKALMLGSFARRFETTGGLAALLANQLAQGRPLAALARYGDDLLAVTPEQVRDFAARHWRAETLHGVIVGDSRVSGADAAASDPADTLRLTLTTLNLDSPGLQRRSNRGLAAVRGRRRSERPASAQPRSNQSAAQSAQPMAHSQPVLDTA